MRWDTVVIRLPAPVPGPIPGRSTAPRARDPRRRGSRALPEAADELGEVLDPAQPLRALPRVQVRHDEPEREAVLRRQRLPAVVRGEQSPRGCEVLEPQGGRVPVLAPGHDVRDLGRRGHEVEQGARGYALPEVVDDRPLRHAVQVRPDAERRQRCELVERQVPVAAGGRRPVDDEPPGGRPEPRDPTVVPHPEAVRGPLPWRKDTVSVLPHVRHRLILPPDGRRTAQRVLSPTPSPARRLRARTPGRRRRDG
jgi:hypothetical protein